MHISHLLKAMQIDKSRSECLQFFFFSKTYIANVYKKIVCINRGC